MKGSPDKAEPWSRWIWSEIVAFFTSVRTTVGLLFLLAATSMVGTVVPQDLTPEQLHQTATSFSQRLMVILDLHQVFRSWWFIMLLTLLALNLVGCLLRRLPAIPGEWRTDYRKNSFSFTITDSRAEQESVESVSGLIRGLMRVQGRILPTETGKALVWTRDRVQLLGFPLMHAGIIVILLGGLVGLFYGVKGHVQIKEGETADRFRVSPSGEIRSLPFTVAVDKFTLTRYPTGEPKEFRSDVRLTANDQDVFKGSILVNHPVSLKGFSLYQADYRLAGVKEVRFLVSGKEGKESEAVIVPHSATELPGTSCRLHLMSLDPGASKRGAGAEIRAECSDRGTELLRLFQKDAKPTELGEVKLRFVGYTPLYVTGLQVGYDPGTPLVWTGCFSLVMGFLLTLFTNHRCVMAEFNKAGKGTTVRISGRSKRLRREFRERVEKTIRDNLECADKL